jgi:hypothetical protein
MDTSPTAHPVPPPGSVDQSAPVTENNNVMDTMIHSDIAVDDIPIQEDERISLKNHEAIPSSEAPLEEAAENPNAITPLPMKKLIIAITVLVCDYLAALALFPYLSQMTCDLTGLDEEKDANLVGYYAGFIGSSYYITQLISA